MSDDFYEAKFDSAGHVRDGWDFNTWVLERAADIPKSRSPDIAMFAWRAA